MKKQTDSAKSNYGRKKAWRVSHCGPHTVLPCYPDIMLLKADQKPWGTKKR